MQWYSKDARDSVRVSDLSNIDLQLELYLIKWSKLPIPDDAITLESTWVIVWYQWTIWENTLNRIWVHGGWKDPLDDSNYTYRINWTKTTYQVMWFLEDWTEIANNPLAPLSGGIASLVANTYAADLTNRFPRTKWKTLWILLEQVTNKPLNQIETWTVDLRTNTWTIDMYLSDTSKKSWTVNELYWTMETLALSQNFIAPEECPTWFIPVPWNRELWQTAFCVAKYEMSYADSYWDVPSSTWFGINFNSIAYSWSKIPASLTGKYPIADITQQEAIESCISIWEWYHLITNNEWTTIARNIEQQAINWSWSVVWENFIYNWVSSNSMWCLWSTDTIYTSLSREWWTKAWWWFWNTDCDNKRQLRLSNWEVIWDLSWNIWEHVNKNNTIDGTNYATWVNPYIWIADGTWGEWFSVTNNYRLDYWPLISLTSNRWVWELYHGPWDIIIRWSSTLGTNDVTGIFTLATSLTYDHNDRNVGFRCAK